MSAELVLRMKKAGRRWHLSLAWVAGAVLLLWAGSGLLHPMMSWLGPQTANFYPPKLSLQPAQLERLPDLLAPSAEGGELSGARLLKVVPSGQGPVLLVNHDRLSVPQYYSFRSGLLLPNFDVQQARWLAAYYSGVEDGQVVAVDRIDRFTDDYPAVNRLLPVYRVRYAQADLQLYVHTETLALASISNRSKAMMQSLFRTIHTFSWLDATGAGRVLLVSLLMITLFAFATTGMLLLLNFKRRKITDGKRRWHRRFSYLLFLPLLAWSASGFYHLLQAAYIGESSDLKLSKPINFRHRLDDRFTWLASLEGQSLNSFTVTADRLGKPLYRVSLAPKRTTVTRDQRFSGRPLEEQARYIDAESGKPVMQNDLRRVTELAMQFGSYDESQIFDVQKIVRYGEGYDFRNKRLPVWQVTLTGAGQRDRLFIDATSAILVDQSRRIDRYERWSFSQLHKWNFLAPLTGRFYRDVTIVITLLLFLLSTALGVRLLLSRRRARRSSVTVSSEVIG
ncbi:hypothetical protein EDC56_0841 [Sinobacterium caligoides]|uniref:PepSY-associated transmembrane protein n=1 Tax=Sinobacterium caligoides TaxID=933926 RepID=A0A3N2DZL5_9GAMM|nr:hypothetical protein [Sinobacterium caligoides]ROS05311.1 hypothetical protein EDC56_0841 [Sinobacterium caligoides]